MWAYLCMMCTSWRQSKIGATKMLRRNWVAQCKFGSGSFSTDQRCLRDVCFPPDRDQIAAFDRLHASARLLIRNRLFACMAPSPRFAGMSFKLLCVFCSVPPLTSHIEIHTASVSVGCHLSGALALQCLLPARACPIVHIHKTLAVNGTFQTTLGYRPYAVPCLILIRIFARWLRVTQPATMSV